MWGNATLVKVIDIGWIAPYCIEQFQTKDYVFAGYAILWIVFLIVTKIGNCLRNRTYGGVRTENGNRRGA